MGTQKKQLTTLFIILIFAFGFKYFSFGNLPTHPVKTINKKSITFIGDKPNGISLEKLPRKAESLNINGFEYRYYGGYFYKEENEKYNRVQAPIGATVKEIPDNYQRIIMSGRIFYYSNGVFYMGKGKKAFVTTYGPIGGQISSLPEGVQKIKIKERNYFLYHDIVFKIGESRSRKYYEVYGYVTD